MKNTNFATRLATTLFILPTFAGPAAAQDFINRPAPQAAPQERVQTGAPQMTFQQFQENIAGPQGFCIRDAFTGEC